MSAQQKTNETTKPAKLDLAGVAYFAGLAIAGITILYFTYQRDWGFWGWMGGGLLALTGIACAVGALVSEGPELGVCPSCEGKISVWPSKRRHVLRCPSCKAYLEASSAEDVDPVSEDCVVPVAVFSARLLPRFSWPEGCSVCGKPATRTVTVRGTDAGNEIVKFVSPVSIERYTEVNAPCCDEHDNGVLLQRKSGCTFIRFRSHRYWQAYCALNLLEPDGELPRKTVYDEQG